MDAAAVQTYNEVALGVHAPIYAYYARRIVQRFGITSGLCLDIGCGGGYLALALTAITNLHGVLLDPSPTMLACAGDNISRFGLADRLRLVRGRVQALPLADGSVPLAVSRGSLPFWDDLPAAFTEIHRVLCPGGAAYIGGGLGDPVRRAELEAACRRGHPHWKTRPQRPPSRSDQEYAAALHQAGIAAFQVQRGEDGLWIVFAKEAGRARAKATTLRRQHEPDAL